MSRNAAAVFVCLFSFLTRAACIAGACYLVVHDHPVMAAWTLVLAFVCGISYESDEEKERK